MSSPYSNPYQTGDQGAQYPDLTLCDTLAAVVYALNAIPNTRLRECPHGIKDTYALVKLVEAHLYFRRHQ